MGYWSNKTLFGYLFHQVFFYIAFFTIKTDTDDFYLHRAAFLYNRQPGNQVKESARPEKTPVLGRGEEEVP
jgi:hypothetical protein